MIVKYVNLKIELKFEDWIYFMLINGYYFKFGINYFLGRIVNYEIMFLDYKVVFYRS